MGFGNHGSVHRENHDNVANLGDWNDEPKLNWNWNDNANPNYGTASRLVSPSHKRPDVRRGACHMDLFQPPSIRPISCRYPWILR